MKTRRKKRRDCGCSGHPAGRKKLSRGPCYGHAVRPAVTARIHNKRIERAWREAIDLVDVED